jgi:L-rhamnose mutarotase
MNRRNGMPLIPFLSLCLVTAAALGCSRGLEEAPPRPEIRVTKRVGMVIGIHPEHIAEYKRLHADGHPGVRDLLRKYHMRNFSIFLTEIGGKWYEFGYYEYTGNDFEADMAELARDPRNIEWLRICDPMQIPLAGEEGWREMERIYFND